MVTKQQPDNDNKTTPRQR